MNDRKNQGFIDIMADSVKNQEQATELMEKLLSVAQPKAVYSEPIQSGAYTVVTASEVSASIGFGYGGGGGQVSKSTEEAEQKENDTGFGGGGGGAGLSFGRPVAVISIGPDGVRVEPVVDPTKIALAFFTTLGAMAMMWGQMRRAGRR